MRFIFVQLLLLLLKCTKQPCTWSTSLRCDVREASMQTAFKQKPPIQLNWEKKHEKTELKIHHHCFRTMIKHIKFRKTINKSHCHLPFALPNVWFTVKLLNWVHDVRIVNIKNGNNQRTKIKIDRATATNKKQWIRWVHISYLHELKRKNSYQYIEVLHEHDRR